METNQLDPDSHLPPRKRLLAGFKKLNGSSSSSASPSPSPSHFASSSNSNGSSSSASTDVQIQTRLDNLLASRFDQNQSPEELVEATRSAAAKAVKAAKAARAKANEKALISAKAIAVAKRALELVDSFPKEAMDGVVSTDCKERLFKKGKQKKHVPVEVLYSKGELRDEEEDLARRLNRAIDNKYSRVLRTCSGFEENGDRYKKQKKNVVNEGGSSSIVTGSMNGNADVVDSDGSFEGLESKRNASEGLNPDEADSMLMKDKEEEESNSFGQKRVKLKKLSLSVCNTKDQENGTSSYASPLPAVTQPREEGVIPVMPGSASWKCQDLKVPECVKQNKAVRS